MHGQRNKAMPRLHKGYLAFAVHCQVAKVTKIIHKQRNKAMSKFYRLQGLLGYLLCIVRLIYRNWLQRL